MARDGGSSLAFLDLLREIRYDPTVISAFSQKQCLELLRWLCSCSAENPVYANQDYTILHCLIKTAPISVNSLLKTPAEPGSETPLSLAVLRDNRDLARYLLKMGASPEILVGWNFLLHRSCSFAFDRLDEENQVVWGDLLLAFSTPPCRHTDPESPSYPLSDSGFLEWVKDGGISRFEKGIEYDIAQVRGDPEVVRSWGRLHSAFVFAKLVKRRPGGAIARDFPIMDAILDSGQVGVDDYLVDETDERVTALHEAVSRKNVPFAKYLLTVRQADPNKRSFVDAMPWNDQTQIVTPLGVSLRGFLVWDEIESAAVQMIAELILRAGISEETQIQTIDNVWHDSVMGMMELQEALHFIRVVCMLVTRRPNIVRHLQRPLSDSLTRLIGACECKWIKETFDTHAGGKAYIFPCILEEGVALLVSASKLDPTPITPETLETLVAARTYRTLAALVKALGEKVPLEKVNFEKIDLTDLLTDEMVEAGISLQQAQVKDAVRVDALVDICILSTIAAQRWLPFLLNLRAVTFNGYDTVHIPLFSLRARCVAAVNDAERGSFLTDDRIKASLPPAVRHDVSLVRQFAVLESLTT